MNKYGRLVLSSVFALAAMTNAQAADKPVAYATSPVGGLQHSAGMAIGKVANTTTGLQVRIVPHGGSTAYLPLIDRGELDVGMTANVEAIFAYNGKAWFKGKPLKNLRVIGSALRFDTGILVKKAAKFKKLTDLKGQTMSVGWKQHKIAHVFYMAALASANMSETDFKGIPVPHLGKAAQAFMQGKIAGLMMPIAAGKTRQVNAKVGGIRFLDADDSPEGIKRFQKVMPGAYITVLKPGKKPRPGLFKPTKFISADYVLVAGKHVGADEVYKIAKTLHQQKAALVKSLGAFKTHTPKTMAKDYGYPYHPGAQKYFKEQGLWPPKK